MDKSLGGEGRREEEVAVRREGEGSGRVCVAKQAVDFLLLAEVVYLRTTRQTRFCAKE